MLRHLLASCLPLILAASAFAQTATLSADPAPLNPQGGTVTLTAKIAYDTAPAALGWSVSLPSGWAFVSVTGPDRPAVAPRAGDTKVLGFAFTEVPDAGATFALKVKYPANPGAVSIDSEAIVRLHNNERKISAPSLTLGSP